MKYNLLILLFCALIFESSGQGNKSIVPSQWIGSIKMGEANPELVFNIFTDSIGELVGSLGIPSKGVKGFPLSRVRLEQDSIILEIAAAQASYKGVLGEDRKSIDGTWQEGSITYPLRLVPLTEEINYEKPIFSSEHFNYYSEKSDTSTLESISTVLEKNYSVIVGHMSTLFGNKIRVYIYPNLESFHAAINYPDAPDWVVGAAGKDELKMVSPLNPGSVHSYESLLEAIVHEFAHTVVINIRENGLEGLPNWLNEGFAYYEANQLKSAHRKSIYANLSKKNIPAWSEIMQANTSKFGDMGGYGLSASIVEFLVQSYGYGKLRQYILAPESVESIYEVSEKELETLWLKHIKKYERE